MKNNLFEMGTDLGEGWRADNKDKKANKSSTPCKEALPPEKHRLHFAKEKRRGKTVTIVKPFCLEKASARDLLKKLKKSLGTGGTYREGVMEFQGDIPDSLRRELEKLGYQFKS